MLDQELELELGFQKVGAQVLEKAQELAKAQGREKVSLQDLDLAQVQGTEWEWVEASEQESALALELDLYPLVEVKYLLKALEKDPSLRSPHLWYQNLEKDWDLLVQFAAHHQGILDPLA